MGITREEQLLKSVATGVASDIKPITREEQYLSYIGGGSSVLPAQPITRKEVLLDTIAKNGIGSGGGGGVTINNQDKTITENGTYTADEGYTGLGTVTVDVQASGGGAIIPFAPDHNYNVFASGTFTTTGGYKDTLNVTVTHGLGFVPHGALLINESHKSNIVYNYNALISNYVGSFNMVVCKKNEFNTKIDSMPVTYNNGNGYTSEPACYNANENTITFGTVAIPSIGEAYTKFLVPTDTYSWIVW